MFAASALRRSWQLRFARWLDRRAPPASSHRLRRDKLYVFPTKTGFAFTILVAILWMLGTNYQNNLILGLCLLLVSVFVLAILRTHSNLVDLDIRLQDVAQGFAGQDIAFPLDIYNLSQTPKDNVQLAWQGGPSVSCAIEAQTHSRIHVYRMATKRGYLAPGRLLVETHFPLGLLRCWSWLNFDTVAVVFPKPENLRELLPHSVQDDRETYTSVAGADDFAALRIYNLGDAPKHIAWKQYARGKELMTKEFSSGVSDRVWLSWEAVSGLDVEQRLSTLSFWALHYAQLNIAYGLDIPGTHIEPNIGPEHKLQVLTALAVFGQERPRHE